MRSETNGIVLAVLGLFLIIFRKWFSRHTVEAQNWTFGFRFGERIIRLNEWIAVPFGLALFVLGALTFFNIIRW